MSEKKYNERFDRYITAMRNEMPDRIPIRPFVAEFTAKYAGYTCQEVTHDYRKAFEAVIKCGRDFDWDAMVPNMVYVWTGLTQALGLKYYAIPGIDIPSDTGFQYIEPPEENAYMKPDEYDRLIDDPTEFLFNVWLPRISKDIGENNSYRGKLALVKGAMAIFQYFNDLGAQVKRMKEEISMPSAISGILKAPLDIIADKLRGYIGLVMDLHTQPDKVLKACEVLAPHLAKIAIMTGDPEKKLPVAFWMHRGCVPFINMEQFKSIYWPTLKPIIEELWRNGYQTLFYAEGNWDAHLDSFSELPEKSIIYHVDRGDIFKVHKKIGNKFCISGGIPNALLAVGSEKEVRDYCKKIIDNVASEGGYIMDASAIIQNDAKIENIRVMTDFTREYGVYSQGHSRNYEEKKETYVPESKLKELKIRPGVCIPWEEKIKEIKNIKGDEDLIKKVWEEIDTFGYIFIWQILLSF
ncbi:MAG TPA: uroporphyrinogen decarboxylase family protein [bacterium]|nr:uroporphyrinogen decarboxylase family protein [bacterium]HOM26654.1 uroporphyrinogen decarboxylase family protein [bacterium]